MNDTWQVQEAKNRFSEVIDRAIAEGPQVVTRHGKPVVRVVAIQAESAGRPAPSPDDGFAEFLLGAPRVGDLEVPVRRSRRAPPDLGT